MRKTSRSLWLAGACALLLSGCASYGYDDYYAYDGYDQMRYYERDRYYDDRYDSRYRYYDDGRYYYAPAYERPRLSLGFGYSRGWYR